MDVNSFVIGYTKGKQSASGGGSGGGSAGGAELNIAYGDTPPEDTTKLWVKTSEPSKVIIKPNTEAFNYIDEMNEITSNSRYYANTHGCCVTMGDYVYVMCGLYQDATTSGSAYINHYVEAFVMSDGNWYRSQKYTDWYGCPIYACCATDGAVIYVFGGFTYSSNAYTAQSVIKVFDPQSRKLTTASAKLPTSMGGACCATVGTKVYIFGGTKNVATPNLLDTILCFDLETKGIETLATKLPVAIQGMCCSAVGTKIYIFGGAGNGTGILDTVYCFDTETKQIELLDVTMPVPLIYSTCSSVGDNIYIFGGLTGESSYDIYRFNTKNHKFYRCKSKLSEGAVGACTATYNDKIVLFSGGEYSQSVPFVKNTSNKMYVLTPGEEATLETGTMQLVTSETKDLFTIVKYQNVQFDVGVDGIFLGNVDGIAEPVESALYNNGAWTSI